MLKLFDQGKGIEFFNLWHDNIKEQKINKSFEAQKLELELNIYFAIFSYKIEGKNVILQNIINY